MVTHLQRSTSVTHLEPVERYRTKDLKIYYGLPGINLLYLVKLIWKKNLEFGKFRSWPKRKVREFGIE